MNNLLFKVLGHVPLNSEIVHKLTASVKPPEESIVIIIIIFIIIIILYKSKNYTLLPLVKMAENAFCISISFLYNKMFEV